MMDIYRVENYLKLAGEYNKGRVRNSYISSGIPGEAVIADKYNFFKLGKELEIKFGVDYGIPDFEIFPTQNIVSRWLKYMEGANSKLKKHSRKIFFNDLQLAALLSRLNKINLSSLKDKRRLLRALGAVCEATFTGPFSIVVDMLHFCNTNCLHCWIHSPLNIHKDPAYIKEKISLEMFSHIAGKAADMGTERICLLANGEPLMHPEIKEMITICGLSRLRIEVFTNGVFMDARLMKLIVDSGAVSITVSLPAANAASYKQICQGSPLGDFEKVKINVRRLVDYRKKTKKKDPVICITHVIHNLNCYDLFQFIEMDRQLGVDRVFFKIIMLDESNYSLKLDDSQVDYLKAKFPEAAEKLKNAGIECDSLTDIYLDFYNRKEGTRTAGFYDGKSCLVGWDFCNVQLGGEVLFCCGNKMVGSLQGNDFGKIWFSDKYNRYRIAAKHMAGSASMEFARGEKLCDARCDSCENVNQHLHILKNIKRLSLEDFL